MGLNALTSLTSNRIITGNPIKKKDTVITIATYPTIASCR